LARAGGGPGVIFMKRYLAPFLVPLAIFAAPLLSVPALERAAGAAGTLPSSVALNRTVTPNHDHKNDTFIFKCYNPRDFHITASIYGLRGEKIASMRLKSEAYPYCYMEWNPDSTGKVPGGVYIYEVILNDKSYKGTVVVVR